MLTSNRTTVLRCISEQAASAVVAEAFREGDTTHTVAQVGDTVVITFFDVRFAFDVADWAFANGHAHDADAAAVWSNVQMGR